ncbi:MAG: mntP 1 [Firmicutes bacterium]|nr:mntP 1 [Bacillota bacterium]
MSLFELFVLSAALGTDLFSVAVPIGMNKVRRLVILQSAIVFAVFHIIMILIGYHIGHWLGSIVEHVGAYHINWPVASVQNFMIDVNLFQLSLVLGTVIFGIGLLGLGLGRKLGRYIGGRAELMGGSVLVLLAIHILWTTI